MIMGLVSLALRPGLAFIAILAILNDPFPAHAQPQATGTATRPPEELMPIHLTATSHSRQSQRIEDAAAAFVLTNEDIRRSRVTSLPDALRLVPGVNVARIDANKWAISVRGFNGRFSNKLNVLIDGRSVYTPIYAGVFWDRQGILLEDVDRIEVVRGPGASHWGANAVNGVINIVTKTAAETQGGLVSVAGGADEAQVAARYGAALSDLGHMRLYGMFQWMDAGARSSRNADNELWRSGQVGFRTDLRLSFDEEVALQGQIAIGGSDAAALFPGLRSTANEVQSADLRWTEGYALGRWTRTLSEGSQLAAQFFYDRTVMPSEFSDVASSTLDLEAEHDFRWGDRQSLQWGLGYRQIRDDYANPGTLAFEPSDRVYDVLSFFAEDQIAVAPDELDLIIGTKFQNDRYAGWQIQPTARVHWAPQDNQALWAAVSRAVRTPSRFERDATLVQSAQHGRGGVPLANGSGYDESLQAEDLVELEAGFRYLAASDLSIDIAGIHSVYDNLRSLEIGKIETPSRSTLRFTRPVVVADGLSGMSWGVEVSAEWQIADDWRVQGAYSFLDFDLRDDGNSTDRVSSRTGTESPAHQGIVRSAFGIQDDLDFDVALRAVDGLDDFGIGDYVGLVTTLAWRPVDRVELSVVGRNSMREANSEFGLQILGLIPADVERSVFGRMAVRF